MKLPKCPKCEKYTTLETFIGYYCTDCHAEFREDKK